MNNYAKTLLFGVVLISLMSFSGTFSHISDSDSSVGNSISVGVWDNQADYLGVDVSQSQLADNQKTLGRIILEDTRYASDLDGFDNEYEGIVIDRIQIYWNVTESEAANVVGITLNDELFFSGSAHYGETIEGANFVLCAENSPCDITFLFDVPVSGPFDIWFTMADGSRKNVLIAVRS